jgi:hemerythrin
MPPLEFDPVLLTGNDEIDAQHRELFARVGQLLDASRERRSREEVVRLLEYLGQYVVKHFAAEEMMMDTSGYDRIESHRLEHRAFVRELEVLRLELKSEGPTNRFVIRVGNRVTTWLREHIYRTDRMFGEWLRHREQP